MPAAPATCCCSSGGLGSGAGANSGARRPSFGLDLGQLHWGATAEARRRAWALLGCAWCLSLLVGGVQQQQQQGAAWWPGQAKSGAYHSPGDLSSSAATLPHYNDGEVAGASAPPCWCRLPSSSLPPGGLQQQQRRALWQRGWCQLGRTAAFLRPRLLRGHE